MVLQTKSLHTRMFVHTGLLTAVQAPLRVSPRKCD